MEGEAKGKGKGEKGIPCLLPSLLSKNTLDGEEKKRKEKRGLHVGCALQRKTPFCFFPRPPSIGAFTV